MHIAKIKSVNLDKWKPELIEMYKCLNNSIVNAFWEAKLPKGFQKPGQNANSRDVESFIRDKYVNRRWVDPKEKADPVTLYMTDRKKFNKYVKKLTEGATAAADDSDEKPKKKSKKSKKAKQSESEEEESEEEVQPKVVPPKLQIQPKLVAPQAKPVQTAPMADLINLDFVPV